MKRTLWLGLIILFACAGCAKRLTRLEQAEKDFVYYEVGQEVALVLPSDDLFLTDHPDRVDPKLYPFMQYVGEMIHFDDPHVVEVLVYHNDNGLDDLALQLTKQQANTVAALLWSQGVPKHRLQIHGYGKRHPIAANDTASARADFQNSHIEIRWWMSKEALLKHIYDQVKQHRYVDLLSLYIHRAEQRTAAGLSALETGVYHTEHQVSEVVE